MSIPDADSPVEISLAIPNNPAFAGLELSFQALFLPNNNPPGNHLSAGITHPLLP